MAVMGLIALRECANLLPDEAAWRAYLTTNEVLLSLLCLLMPVRWLGVGLCMIFLSQAVDEAMGGNLFSNGMWEYPLAGLLLLMSRKTLRKR